MRIVIVMAAVGSRTSAMAQTMVGAVLLPVSVGGVVPGARSCGAEVGGWGALWKTTHVLPVCLVPETLPISLQAPGSCLGWDSVQV